MREVSGHVDASAAHPAYLEIVRALITKNNWSLVPEDDLVARVSSAGQPAGAPDDPARRATYHYTIALYEACRQAGDPERRELAYSDLFSYLYRVAYHRWPDLATAVAQRALALAYEQIDRCREPPAFLNFALFKLRQAVTEITRNKKGDLSLDQLEQFGPTGERDTIEALLIRQECWRVLLDAITRLPNQQKQTITLKFLEGLSDEEIAARLGIRAGTIRVMRHRVLERLRQDPRLRENCLP